MAQTPESLLPTTPIPDSEPIKPVIHSRSTEIPAQINQADSKIDEALSLASLPGYWTDQYIVYTDASKWGVGVVIDEQWNAWSWNATLDVSALDPSCIEALAVEVGVEVLIYLSLQKWLALKKTLFRHVRTVRNHGGTSSVVYLSMAWPSPSLVPKTRSNIHNLIIHCDNVAVVGSWNKGISHKPFLQEWIPRLKNRLERHHCTLTLELVAGKENLANGPSRGLGLGDRKQMTTWNRALGPSLRSKLILPS